MCTTWFRGTVTAAACCYLWPCISVARHDHHSVWLAVAEVLSQLMSCHSCVFTFAALSVAPSDQLGILTPALAVADGFGLALEAFSPLLWLALVIFLVFLSIFLSFPHFCMREEEQVLPVRRGKHSSTPPANL